MFSYKRAVNVSGNVLPHFIETDAHNNSLRKDATQIKSNLES